MLQSLAPNPNARHPLTLSKVELLQFLVVAYFESINLKKKWTTPGPTAPNFNLAFDFYGAGVEISLANGHGGLQWRDIEEERNALK